MSESIMLPRTPLHLSPPAGRGTGRLRRPSL